MRVTSALLDIYDDPEAAVLTKKLAGASLPEELAESTLLSEGDLGILPDRLFGLVADLGDGTTLRKYAMHDAPHLTTSILYFLEQGHQLPEEAQKVAAQNLYEACSWYDMEPPEALVKVAAGPLGILGAMVHGADASSRISAGRERSKGLMQGFQAAQAGATQDMQQIAKHADLNGTEMMPMSGDLPGAPLKRNTAQVSAMPQNKTAGWKHAGVIGTYSPKETKKVANSTMFALPSRGAYPIESYEAVKVAADYFEEHWTAFDLADRREYAQNLTERMQTLGLIPGINALKYAGEDFGPNIATELVVRARNFEGTEFEEVYSTILEKRAEATPEEMVDILTKVDAASGAAAHYNTYLGFRDPYQAVYGKFASDIAWSWSEGDLYINEPRLRDLVTDRYQSLDRAFGLDFRKSIQKDPIGVFMSLPDPQKAVIARLAADDGE